MSDTGEICRLAEERIQELDFKVEGLRAVNKTLREKLREEIGVLQDEHKRLIVSRQALETRNQKLREKVQELESENKQLALNQHASAGGIPWKNLREKATRLKEENKGLHEEIERWATENQLETKRAVTCLSQRDSAHRESCRLRERNKELKVASDILSQQNADLLGENKELGGRCGRLHNRLAYVERAEVDGKREKQEPKPDEPSLGEVLIREGKERVEFEDGVGDRCYVSNSGSVLRLGCCSTVIGQVWLSQDQVKALAATMRRWLDTGSFKDSKEQGNE